MKSHKANIGCVGTVLTSVLQHSVHLRSVGLEHLSVLVSHAFLVFFKGHFYIAFSFEFHKSLTTPPGFSRASEMNACSPIMNCVVRKEILHIFMQDQGMPWSLYHKTYTSLGTQRHRHLRGQTSNKLGCSVLWLKEQPRE